VSQENVEVLVRESHDAFNRRDLDAWVGGWDEHCEYQPAMERDMTGDDDSYCGHEGLRRWWQEMSDAWSDLHTEVHEVRAVGDRVFVSLTLRGKGRVSGAEMEAPFCQVGTIRDGKISSSRDYAEREQALDALGLSE
jgi:ketosteroid isomerase-like protein